MMTIATAIARRSTYPFTGAARFAGCSLGRRARQSYAFTLLEVLASLAFTAILLPVTTSGLSLVLKAADQARHQAQASHLAQMELAEIRTVEIPGGGVLNGDFLPEYPGYSWTAQGTAADTAGLWLLELSVKWRNRGQDREVLLSTLVYVAQTS